MWQFLRRFRDPIISAICLALPFFFLNANLKDPSKLNFFDRFLVQISAPLQAAVDSVAEAAAHVVDDYVYLVHIRRENEKLHYENARLREENHRFQRAEIELRRLRRMLEFRDTFEAELRTARVIAIDRDPATSRVVRISIDRGQGDQVRPAMPVVTPAGLVGEVRRSAGGWAEVLLTVDPGCHVAAVIERTGAHGILHGRNEMDRYEIEVEHLDTEHEVRVGDLVHTSGEDRKFPAGILVGRISQLDRGARDLYQHAYVRPTVDFTSLDEVFVVMKSQEAELGTPAEER